MNGLPDASRLSGLARSAAFVARLLRAYVVDGVQYVDLAAPASGRPWFGVPVLTLGGAPDRHVHAPLRPPQDGPDGAQRPVYVLCLMTVEEQPVALGTLPAPKLPGIDVGGLGLVEEAPEDDGDRDREDVVGADDTSVRNGGSSLVVAADGTVAARVAKAWKVALPSGGVARYSREGDASERLVLAGPLRAALAELVAAVNTAASEIKAIGSFLASDGYISTYFTPGLEPPGQEIAAATFHVCADSEAGVDTSAERP